MKSFQNSRVLTVSELTQSIKSSLELQFRFIHIQGEISNLRIPYSGHNYFTLKDSEAQIRCVLFKTQARYLQRQLREGLNVICHGRLSVYEVRGEYQLIIDTVDFAGTGNLQQQFEQLKRQLSEEGLFDKKLKKKIPTFPEHIVVITSATGAAVQDFLKVAKQRKYWGKISIFPVAVQGKNSTEDIVAALDLLSASTLADVLVLLRGGGSLEDLWSFNEEQMARAIHRATIPVVTGIGHDTDFTIADMCADLYAHTPTAAGEAIIIDGKLLKDSIAASKNILTRTMIEKLTRHEETILALRRIMGNLDLYLTNSTLKLDSLVTALISAIMRTVSSSSANIDSLKKRLEYNAPLATIRLQEMTLIHHRSRLIDTIKLALQRHEQHLASQAALLDSVSPLSVLARGYAIASKTSRDSKKKEIIAQASQVEKGEKIEIKLHQGELGCLVIDKEEGQAETRGKISSKQSFTGETQGDE